GGGVARRRPGRAHRRARAGVGRAGGDGPGRHDARRVPRRALAHHRRATHHPAAERTTRTAAHRAAAGAWTGREQVRRGDRHHAPRREAGLALPGRPLGGRHAGDEGREARRAARTRDPGEDVRRDPRCAGQATQRGLEAVRGDAAGPVAVHPPRRPAPSTPPRRRAPGNTAPPYEGSMMDIVRIPVGPLQANAYLVVVDAGDAVVVDPGDEGERIAAEITRLGVAPREVWLTHAHFDHVGGLAALLRAFPLPVRMHDADRPLLEHAERAAAGWGFAIEAPPTETVSVTHGQTLRVGAHGREARALHTP